MLRSIFILMLVALMASVGMHYENQAGGSQATLESGIDHRLVAATTIRRTAMPVRSSPEPHEAIASNTSLVNTAVEFKRLGISVPFSISVYPAFCVLDGRAVVDE